MPEKRLYPVCRKNHNLPILGAQTYIGRTTLVISKILVILDMQMKTQFFCFSQFQSQPDFDRCLKNESKRKSEHAGIFL